jgi:uncharacterized protein (TIGR02246 family)
MRTFAFPALLSLVLVMSAVGAFPARGSQASGNERDHSAVTRLFTEEFAGRWRAGDAAGLAELWLEDGDWMGLLGSRRVQSGRQAVEGVWSIGLDGRETPWHRALSVEVDGLRRLGPDLFQVDLLLTFGSAATGLVREAMVAVAARDGESWRVASARVARISSEPPSLAEPAPMVVLEESWSLPAEHFCEPETVVWDAARRIYVVSNVCGFAVNGKGFLSRISEDGELVEARWVTGLDAPVGMVVDGDSVWVVDLRYVREISLEDGSELSRIEMPAGARAPNDLARLGDALYVSESFAGAVYRIEGDRVSLLAQDERLRFANGVHTADGRLWIGGETLREVDPETGSIGPPLGPLALTDIDGIEGDGDGGLIFSLVGGPVVHLAEDGSSALYTVEGLTSTNFLFRADESLAVVPQGTDSGVVAFRVPLE